MSTADIAPFDEAAETYDATFSTSLLGRLLRRAVHDEIEEAFAAGDKILDLGCGTGEDALHFASRGIRVHGIDASESMVLQARAKVGHVRGVFDVGDLDEDVLPNGPFEGAIANFGVLNCLHDRAAFADRLRKVLRPGARAFFVVMGRRCALEWVLHVLRGRPDTAFRRLRGRAEYGGKTIYYPTPADLRRDFRPHFRWIRTAGIGILLPPTEAAAFIERHARMARALDAAERRIRPSEAMAQLSDHFLIELERL